MIVVTIFLSILNQMDFEFEPIGFPLGSNRKENCRHDHIPFNSKGNGIQVFSAYRRGEKTGTVGERRRALIRSQKYVLVYLKKYIYDCSLSNLNKEAKISSNNFLITIVCDTRTVGGRRRGFVHSQILVSLVLVSLVSLVSKIMYDLVFSI